MERFTRVFISRHRRYVCRGVLVRQSSFASYRIIPLDVAPIVLVVDTPRPGRLQSVGRRPQQDSVGNRSPGSVVNSPIYTLPKNAQAAGRFDVEFDLHIPVIVRLYTNKIDGKTKRSERKLSFSWWRIPFNQPKAEFSRLDMLFHAEPVRVPVTNPACRDQHG